MPITKPVAKAAQQRQSQKSAALRLASQNARQSLHNGPAFPGIPQGVQNIALERQGIRPPMPGGVGIGHAPIFTGAPAPINGTGLPDNSGYAPGQLTPGGGGGIQQSQQAQIDSSGLATTSDGTQIYTDPVSGLQYQNVNGEWNEVSGYLTDPGAGTGTYNGLPQGVNQLAPGQHGYSAPGTPMNQVPGYYQADAQGGYLSGDWNAYSQYANSRGVTPFAGPGSTYGGNPVTPPNNVQQPPVGDLQQAMLNASQSGANSNPNTIQPQTPVTPAPVSPVTSSQTVTSPTVQPTQNPQQLGNQNIPGFISNTPEGGQQPANRILPRPGNPAGIATRPVVRPLGSVGNMMGSGFGGAASRLMGRL